MCTRKHEVEGDQQLMTPCPLDSQNLEHCECPVAESASDTFLKLVQGLVRTYGVVNLDPCCPHNATRELWTSYKETIKRDAEALKALDPLHITLNSGIDKMEGFRVYNGRYLVLEQQCPRSVVVPLNERAYVDKRFEPFPPQEIRDKISFVDYVTAMLHYFGPTPVKHCRIKGFLNALPNKTKWDLDKAKSMLKYMEGYPNRIWVLQGNLGLLSFGMHPPALMVDPTCVVLQRHSSRMPVSTSLEQVDANPLHNGTPSHVFKYGQWRPNDVVNDMIRRTSRLDVKDATSGQMTTMHNVQTSSGQSCHPSCPVMKPLSVHTGHSRELHQGKSFDATQEVNRCKQQIGSLRERFAIQEAEELRVTRQELEKVKREIAECKRVLIEREQQFGDKF